MENPSSGEKVNEMKLLEELRLMFPNVGLTRVCDLERERTGVICGDDGTVLEPEELVVEVVAGRFGVRVRG